MNKRFLIISLGLIIAATLIGGLIQKGFGKSHSAPGKPPSADEVVDDYHEALTLVTENYAGEINYEKAAQTSIQGMLWVLDPHSSFFTATEYEKLQEDQSSRFYGVGVSILQHRDGVYVQAVVPETPAERAGLKYGDRIIEVDGKDAREWSSSEVSRNVRGPFGENVRIKVERAGAAAPLEFVITRDAVPSPSIRNFFMIKPGVGYIGLTGGFQKTTDDELGFAIAKLKTQGMNQLVLDLRGNPGGILEQAIKVASRFIPHGEVITSVKGRTEYSVPEVYRSIGKDTENFPLVLLINHNSASASEIVAGAIQDHGRGYIVGQTSFGKGLVQHVYRLLGGTGLTLTTARYYTPYGRSLQRDYSNGSLYDYYVQHDDDDPATAPAPSKPNSNQPPPIATPTPTPTPTGPGIATAGGRMLYGGGGVQPDQIVKPESGTVLRGRIAEAAFYFTRQLVAGLIPGPTGYTVSKPTLGHDLRDNEYVIGDDVVTAFKTFVGSDPKFGLKPEQIDAELAFTRVRIRSEVVTAAFGIEAGNRVLLEVDNQVLRGIEAFPDAKRLSDLVHGGGPIS
jgi:carboxyl-terminal processing protease